MFPCASDNDQKFHFISKTCSFKNICILKIVKINKLEIKLNFDCSRDVLILIYIFEPKSLYTVFYGLYGLLIINDQFSF